MGRNAVQNGGVTCFADTSRPFCIHSQRYKLSALPRLLLRYLAYWLDPYTTSAPMQLP